DIRHLVGKDVSVWLLAISVPDRLIALKGDGESLPIRTEVRGTHRQVVPAPGRPLLMGSAIPDAPANAAFHVKALASAFKAHADQRAAIRTVTDVGHTS